MDNNHTDYKNNKRKIVIPIIIVILVFAIWLIKNVNKNDTTISENKGINEQDAQDFSLHVTDNFDIEHLKSFGLPIIIDFGADSCIPCKEMAPVLKELNEELRGKAIIKFVDVWKYPELAQNFPLKVIPTQYFFDKDGKPYEPSLLLNLQMIKYSTNDTNEHIYTAHEGGMTKEQLFKVLKEMGLE